MMTDTTDCQVLPLSGALGAEILGVDLTQPSERSVESIRNALLKYGVIAIRDQSFSPGDLLEFASQFGAPDRHPITKGMTDYPDVIKIHKAAGDSASFGVGWHSDNSYKAEPSKISILYGDTLPPYGGDTLFASQYLAYERMSVGMKDMLAGLHAVHSPERAFTAPSTKEKWEGKTTIEYQMTDALFLEEEHPVIRTHPETGRKALYVNDMFTVRFRDMSESESQPLLEYLYMQGTRPELTCRVRWTPGTVTIWDNRCVQHNALDDYQEFERVMFRVTIKGDRPF